MIPETTKQALTPEEIVARQEAAPSDVEEFLRRTLMPAVPIRAVSTTATYWNGSAVTADTRYDKPGQRGTPE